MIFLELEEQAGVVPFRGKEDSVASRKNLQTLIKDIAKIQRLVALTSTEDEQDGASTSQHLNPSDHSSQVNVC